MKAFRIAGLALVMMWAGSHVVRDLGSPSDPAFAADPPKPGSAMMATMTMPTAAPIDTFAAERDSMMNAVLASITGRENAPAESVFKNIQLMKGVPAGRLPRIMNMGYGKSLGVRCAHCHDTGKWDSDDKPQKQVTRDMAAMTRMLNLEALPKIKNLRSEKPTVNCTTCHRGSIKPAQNL